MSRNNELFEVIVEEFSMNNDHVEAGKMMSSPGLKYRNKVFAFFYEDAMTFKLGKDFEPSSLGISTFSYLSPFKNKPPMKAWFQIEAEDAEKWRELTVLSLAYIKRELGEE